MTDNVPASSGLRKIHVPGATASSTPPGTNSERPRSEAPRSDQATALLREAKASASDLLHDAALVATSIVALIAAEGATFADRIQAAKGADSAQRDAHREEAQAGFSAHGHELRLGVDTSAAELAPGAASAGWQGDWTGSSRPQAPSGYLRFGTISSPESVRGVPALAPLLNHSGWFLSGPTSETLGQVQGALARIVAESPLRNLRISVFDPRIEGSIAMFARLRTANAASFASPDTHADGFKLTLAGVVATVSRNAELITGNGARDLGHLWELNGAPEGENVVVVVLNYPAGLDTETHATLCRIAETGASRGVSLLVQHDPAASSAEPLDTARLASLLTPLTAAGGFWTSPGYPDGIIIADDGPPPNSVIASLVSGAIDAASSELGPVVNLSEFIDGTIAWSESSVDSIDAVIGRSGRDPLTISLRSENPPQPNLLVGGAVGQGKSNLLLDIIYSLASRYSPDDLEFILLDFKQGLEFARFGSDESGANWLPHVRVLSLESNKPFGLAVLDYVAAEMERRAEVFKSSGSNSIGDYRKSTGEPMPRLLLIIDEFQILFDGDDDLTDDAVGRLELLARQGRALGIHLLLATQSISGISGLRTKGDSIFAQFPIRVSLKNTVDESHAILSRDNRAAAELSFRGELIVNRNFGLDPAGSNQRGIAAFAEPEWVKGLQARLWARAVEPARPLVFLGRSYAAWPTIKPCPVSRGELSVWLGMPMRITELPAEITFHRDTDQAVALVGRGDAEAAATLGAILMTASRTLPVESQIVILDGDSESSDSPRAWLDLVLAEATANGLVVERIARDAISAYLLNSLYPVLSVPASQPNLVIGLGLQKVADLGEEHSVNEEDSFADRISGASVLRLLATRGATRGYFFVGWWSSVRTVSETMSYSRDGIGTYILLSVGADDLREILGPQATKVDGSPRITVVDQASDERAQTVIPFALVTPEILEATR